MKFSGGFAPLDPHQGSALRCTLCSLLHIYFFLDSRFACGGMSDLIIVIYFINFINFDFNFKFFLLQCKEIYTLKLIVTLNFSLLCHDICFQSFFPSFLKVDLYSANASRSTDAIRWQMFSSALSGYGWKVFKRVSSQCKSFSRLLSWSYTFPAI